MTVDVSRYLVSPVNSSIGTIASFDRVFRHSDRAYANRRDDQRYMRDDLDVAMPLEIRMGAGSLLDWDVEPEDPEDPVAVAKASALRKSLEKMRRFEQFRRSLQLAVFYGHSANQMQWHRFDRPIEGTDEESGALARIRYAPTDWLPVHPDSVLFATDGTPVIRTRSGSGPSAYGEIVQTPHGPAIMPNDIGRRMLVVNTANIEAGDFEQPQFAATMFAGKSLRDMLFETWWIKQQVIRYAVRFTERLAWGTIVGRYRDGSQEEQRRILDIIENMMNDVAIALPTTGDPSEATPDIEIKEVSGQGWQSFQSLVMDYFTKRIQQMILGQTLTTEGQSVGLGAKTSETHERTFARLVRMDVLALDSSITRDVVHSIEKINWPDDEPCCKFVSLVERMENPQFIAQIAQLAQLGLPMRADDVRQRLQLRRPDPEDEVIGGRVQQGLGVDILGGL